MELEEAIKILKYLLANRNTDVYTPINYEAVEVVLNHLKQKEHETNYQKNYCKMIEEQKDDIIKSMAERMSKQEKIIENAKDRIEYYLMGNSTLNDFSVREKELERLLKILNKANEEEE